MAKIEWDKPGARRYEIGVDHGVLYPGDSEGVPWNGLVSVDEDASGAEQESLYFDGYKYYDYVSNEEFQATLSAFTYPDEFEACLGRVMVSPGAYASGQPRKTFGLAWRTKIADDLDGDRGYKLHILYNATALPSSKSYQTHAETPAPVNFQWQITAVPVLPGESLVNQGVDPNDWVWPEGYGMPGWPVGPDGNTPVPGWRGFPYVIIDSTDPTIDPVALDTLNTHLNGTDITPPYLPDPVALNQILNGVDVPYNYNFDWTPDPVSDAGPKFYWTADTTIIQSYNPSTGAIRTLLDSDPRIPASLQGFSLGDLIRLGNNKLLVKVNASGGTQSGFIVDEDLVPTGEVWAIAYNQYYPFAGYSSYEVSDGLYDPETGLNWLTDTVAAHPWEWNGFDNAGRFVAGRGDCIRNSSGDGFIGAANNIVGPSKVGRWLYRNGPDVDIITRNHLDTDAWECVQNELQDPSDPGQGFGCWLLGVDDTEGMITLNIQSDQRPNYDGKRGWIQIRDVSTAPWTSPVPNGFATPIPNLGRPLRQYDPEGPGGPRQVLSLTNTDMRTTLVQNGKLYYASTNTQDIEYSVDADDNPQGESFGIYAMDLADGTITKVCSIPYKCYDAQGNETKYTGCYAQNLAYAGPRNLMFVETAYPEGVSNLHLIPPITWNTADYGTKTWAVPQTVYGPSEDYSAVTDNTDETYIRNTRSLLDTAHGGSAGTEFKMLIVADGGTKQQIDGMTISFRVRAGSDMGLTQAPVNIYLSDTYRYVVPQQLIPADNAWHDITVTITEQALIDATANADILQGMFSEMNSGGMLLDVYTDSAWGDNVGAAAPWNFWLDFSKIEVHGA